MAAAAINLAAQVPATPLVETFVGQWDPNSPRALIGMDRMQTRHPDSFVGLLYHVWERNGQRPGLLTVWPNPYDVANTPTCVINRKYVTDPYYGNSNTPMAIDPLWETYWEQESPLKVSVSLKQTSPNVLTATAMVGFVSHPPSSLYRVAFVLVGDGITTEAFDSRNGYVSGQRNNYVGDDQCQGADWEVYTKGSDIVTGVKYNNVVLFYDTPYEGRTLAINPSAGTAYGTTRPFLLNQLTNQFGDKINVPNNAYRVVAIIIDGAGRYVNCATSGYPTNATTSLEESLLAKEVSQVVYRDLHGRRIAKPKGGELCIKTTLYTDGSQEVSKEIAPGY